MGYLSIDNLYKPHAQRILEFKRLFALEKVHGTSAHLKWDGDETVTFFSGGEKHENFIKLFDRDAILATFKEKFGSLDTAVTIYGEAYGGKQQGMSDTYGPNLKFVAFDVLIGKAWLAVDQAAAFVRDFGIEFVDYALIDSSLASIDAERDKPSTQAVRNGITEPRIREGVVLRPPFEVTLNNGERLIVKHKRDEFRETKTSRVVNKEAQLKYKDAADEFVTAMRLEHVIGQLVASRENKEVGMEDMAQLIPLMMNDVLREGGDELIIEDAKSFQRSITAATAKLLKIRLNNAIWTDVEAPKEEP